MRLKDVIFLIIIAALAIANYFIFYDLFIALFTLIFLGIIFLENESASLWLEITQGKLKLVDNKIASFKEFYELIKWWLTLILPLTFGLTSLVIALRNSIPHYWTLIPLFMWAILTITVSFTVFLNQTIKSEKSMGKYLLLNSLFLWLFIGVTGALSGFVASYFQVTPYEDLIVCIFPIFMFELVRLDFLRGTIYSIKFSSVEQTMKLLELNPHGYSANELAPIKSKIYDYLTRSNAYTRRETEILTEFNNGTQKTNKPNWNSMAEIAAISALKKGNEVISDFQPFVVENTTYLSAYFRSSNSNIGFAVYDLAKGAIASDHSLLEKIAMCSLTLNNIKQRDTKDEFNAKSYRLRLVYALQERLNRVISKQILTNLTKWFSSSDENLRKRHETNIELDITALLDRIITKSIFYNRVALQAYEQKFLKDCSFETVNQIVNCHKRGLILSEDYLSVWTQRLKASQSLSEELLGSDFIVRTSEFNQKTATSNYELNIERDSSFKNELSDLLAMVRT